MVDEYLTFSQFESWGGTIAWMVGSLVLDNKPEEKSDNDVVFTYTGPVKVEATKEDFRLPSKRCAGRNRSHTEADRRCRGLRRGSFW